MTSTNLFNSIVAVSKKDTKKASAHFVKKDAGRSRLQLGHAADRNKCANLAAEFSSASAIVSSCGEDGCEPILLHHS